MKKVNLWMLLLMMLAQLFALDAYGQQRIVTAST